MTALSERIREAAAHPKPRRDLRNCGTCKERMLAKMRIDVVAQRAAGFEGRIVVVMPVRNEGVKAVETVRQLRAMKAPGTHLHFAVVDDGSTDRCCEIFKPARDCTVWRNVEPMGQGVARNLGVLAQEADAYLSIDAHIEIGPHDAEKLAVLAEESGGVVGCLSGSLANRKNFRGCGHRWERKPNPVGRAIMGSVWNYHRVDTRALIPVHRHAGACYAFTRKTYDRFGGFGETRGLYGFFERDLAVRCRFTGVPQLVYPDALAWHWYRKNRPYRMTGLGYWQGYVESLRTTFRPDVWKRVFEPAARRTNDSRLHDPVLDWMLRDPRLLILQADFERKKVVSDEEVLGWLGLT
ncbi:MAG TPA: glycosyltransferase family A protein [Phycisphaerae bacterium]|nr:glycosyltransferase family A protein [Phycisphaerae bacterium]